MSSGTGHFCGRSPWGGDSLGRAAFVGCYPAFAAHDDASPMGVSGLRDAVFWPGATGRPSAAPGSLAREPARTVLLPRRSPASFADPRSAAARRPGAPAHADGAGSSPSASKAGPVALAQDAAGDVHDLTGESGDQPPHLVAREGIHGRRLRLQLLAAPVRLSPVGRGLSHVAPLVQATMANAGAGTSFNSPMCPSAVDFHAEVSRVKG